MNAMTLEEKGYCAKTSLPFHSALEVSSMEGSSVEVLSVAPTEMANTL